MNRGLSVADLQGVHILKHLPDDELAQIKYIHVYGNNRCGDEDSTSALYITESDEVFLAGYDNLIEKSSCCPPKVLKGSLKIQELSGKSVQKIVVGEEFGAALTSWQELYLWGYDVGRNALLPDGLMGLNVKACSELCSQCSESLCVYLNLWSWCGKCQGEAFCNKVSIESDTEDSPGITCLGYPKTSARPQIPSVLLCVKCGYNWWSTLLVGDFYIIVCGACHSVIEEFDCIPPQTIVRPHKVRTAMQIKDIAVGLNFLLIRSSLQLIIWGEIWGSWYNQIVTNPDEVKFTKVACGSHHIAAITDKGEVYTCGAGYKGQLGYEWSKDDDYVKLKKVGLSQLVEDVSCGTRTTMCLLQDRQTALFGYMNSTIDTGKVYHTCGNILDALLKQQVQYVTVPIEGFIDGYVLPLGLKPENTAWAVRQLRSSLLSRGAYDCSFSASLYGKQLLSDLNLILADGDFPVHRSVLYCSSDYFRKLFEDSEPPRVLDVSSYNATAYHGLLKYLYGVPVGRMSWEDLFDLYVLAASYGEYWIHFDVYFKIESSINVENVRSLAARAREVDAALDVVKACDTFMETPEFQQSLTQMDWVEELADVVDQIMAEPST